MPGRISSFFSHGSAAPVPAVADTPQYIVANRLALWVGLRVLRAQPGHGFKPWERRPNKGHSFSVLYQGTTLAGPQTTEKISGFSP